MLNTKILILFIRISFALNWIRNEDFEYLIASDDKVSFVNATTEECKSKGAEALTLTSEEETNFIKSKCPRCNFWLPFRRNGSKEFIGLIKNQVLDTKIVQWSIGEPKNEFCVEYKNGLLYTLNCNLQSGYACRRKYKPASSVRKIRQTSGSDVGMKDPCYAHSVWKDDKSRAPVSDPPIEILCDIDLEQGWYRLKSLAGNRMPTTCVRPPGCGTLQPIWMDGNLPSEDDGIVVRKACVSSGTNCCASSWNIKVKACPGYYVYFLQETISCFRAYCIGKTKAECLDCDFGIFPTLTEQPTVIWRNRNSQLELVCDTNYKLRTPADGPYIFEIEWFADGQNIHREVLSANRNQATLAEKYLVGKFGKTITCQVRGRFEDGDFSPKKTSNGFLFGIKINNPGTSLVLKPGEAGKISFKLMFPLICPRELNECALRLFTGLDITNAQPTCPDQIKIDEAVIKCPTSNINNAFCGLVITNKNWDQNHEISIAATIHSQTTITKKYSIKLCTFDTTFLLWKDLTIEVPIQVTITALNIVNNICYSYNDPHMQTFDGMKWEHPYVGTYILYRNTKSRFEVQAYYTACPNAPTVTCNCAVAIKSSDKLITIDRCATGNMDPLGKKIARAALIRAITLPSPKENQRTHVYRHEEGRRYEIHFPTGTYVDVTQSYGNLINIAIRASAYDISSTEGLCGTFNGNTGDDYKLRDGSFACNPTSYCQKFSKDWEVSIHKGGLFIDQYDTSTTFSEDIFCKCIMKDGKLPDKSCQHNNNIQVCQNVKNGKDITEQLNNIGDIKKRSTYHDYVDDNHFDANWAAEYLNKRKKREVEDKIVKTWTTDTARKHCQESLKASSAGKFCDKVPNVEFNSKIEFCILDIMSSQSTMYVNTAVEAVKEECMTELNRNTSLWVQNKDPKTGETISIPPPEIEDNLCINDCNNHGTCEKSVCKCGKGFLGGDCSIKAGVPPEVYYIPQGGLCDKQSRPCASTVVYGLNFVDSDQLTCHLEIVSITMPNGGYHPLEEKLVNLKASFQSFGEVHCPIPITKDKDIASWIIYISNDGKLKSKDGVLFTVYNSNCIICKPEGMCSLEVNSCLIQNQCFKAGESNGAKRPCDKCRPEINASQWTKESACATTSNPTPSTKFLCLSAWGQYTHPLRCTHYIECRNWQPFIVTCGLARYYNPATKSCVSPREVPHCIKGRWF